MYNMLPSLMVIYLPFMFQTNSSLVFLWIMLEMSSIMFICVALSEEEMKKKESLLVYFLIQSFASALLLVCLFSWTFLMKPMTLESPNNTYMLISILLSLKIAMGPFHFWLVKMSKLISWFVMGILLTWQKIIPLSFFSTFSMSIFMNMLCMISLLIGTLSQMKLTSMKMLMVFSSISHLGWMLFALVKSPMMVLLYLLIYSTIVLPMMSLFFFTSYQYLFNQVSYKVVIPLFMMILSLSGIPPLMGFLLKWVSLTFMIDSVTIMMLFSLMACVSFYIYIRITYKSFLTNPISLKLNTLTTNVKSFWVMSLFLPILPMLW